MFVWALKTALLAGRKSALWQIFSSIFKGIEPVIGIYLVSHFIASVAQAIQGKEHDINEAVRWLAYIVALGVASKLVDAVTVLTFMRYQASLQNYMEKQLIEKMYTLSQDQFDDELFNVRLSKAVQAKDSVNDIFHKVLTLTSATLAFLTSMGTILYHTPLVGIILAATVLPSLLIEINTNKKRDLVETENDKDWRIMSRTGWLLIDPVRMPEIRLLGAYHKLLNVWIGRKKNIFKREIRTEESAQKKLVIGKFVQLSGEVFANLWFLRMVFTGGLGLENFLFLRGLLTEAATTISTLISSIQGMHKNYIELKNLSLILFTPPNIKDGDVRIDDNCSLSVEFKNVSFKYPKSDSFCLENICFSIKPGEKVALVGKNGSGKSTIAKLLLRQYIPSSGDIRINGIDVRELDIESFHSRLSILVQNFSLFEHLTIEENIKFGVPRLIEHEEMISAAKQSGAHEFITKLKNGYQQRLMNTYDDGVQLSGGELQRVSLARCFARGADFFVLDEPTSAIDAKGEEEIFSQIFELFDDKSALIISHRFSTVRKADRIIVLDGGSIVETGSHEELIRNGGLYMEMFELQASGYR